MCGAYIKLFQGPYFIILYVHFLVEVQNKVYLMVFSLFMCDLTLKYV